MRTILVVDDEKNIRSSLATTFQLEGYRVQTAEDGNRALEAVERDAIDAIVLDMQMPGLDGFETLRELSRREHRIPVIFLTAHGSVERAVEAVKLGAFDFIEKPPHSQKILLAVKNALRQADLEEENHELRAGEASRFDMIGAAPPMRELFEQIARTAPTQARVLVVGENGTGKELIARALHRHSTRAAKPFVRVNCAAIPRELFESELFGHERGAFTGATTRRRGKFIRADGGTVFLDEVAEIPSELQAKLLRALESGEVEPVGAEREITVDVRVIAATNRDLEQAVAEGAFRRDLYYRLQVVTLRAPALRERKGDISELTTAFLRVACEENHRKKTLDEDALEQIVRHDFPGNVRELKNLVDRLVILTEGPVVTGRDVERALSAGPRTGPPAAELRGNLRETLAAFEREVVLRVLEACQWRMTAAADELGLERSHLYKKLKVLGIERPE
jgi:DNA-binding NtrC family response regulator